MEPDNACCSVCTTREAQCFCICQFPLPALCSFTECTDAHVGKKSALFHYFLPTTAPYYVTARNHRSYQQWVLLLYHSQSKLMNSLSLLDAAIMHIEESYQRQVAALTALKDQYIERVNQLKQAATQAFQTAVSETSHNAVNGEYIRQSDIAEWIWTTASKAEDDDIPLFSCEIREKGVEEIGEMIGVKVTSAFQSLAPWGMDFPAETLKMNREELDKLIMKIATLEQKDKDSENVIRSLREEMENNQKKSEQLMAEVLERMDISETPAVANKQMQLKPPESSSIEEEKSADQSHMKPLTVEDKASINYSKTQLQKKQSAIHLRPQLQENQPEIDTSELSKSDVSPESWRWRSEVRPIPIKSDSLRDMKPLPHEIPPVAISQLEEDKDTPPQPNRNKVSSTIDIGKKEFCARETGTREKLSGARCKVCNSEFVSDDLGFQCQNACLCRLCSFEQVIARGRLCCMHCNRLFSSKVISTMQRYAKKCHVCGIALPLNAFAVNANCDVCLRCIKVTETWAKCMKCRDYNFHIKDEEVTRIRTNSINSACCNYAEGNLFHCTLRCGHPVCKVHKQTLLVCRTCWAEVPLC